MPAEALVELCDEMGLMLMIEPFDEWEVATSRSKRVQTVCMPTTSRRGTMSSIADGRIRPTTLPPVRISPG